MGKDKKKYRPSDQGCGKFHDVTVEVTVAIPGVVLTGRKVVNTRFPGSACVSYAKDVHENLSSSYSHDLDKVGKILTEFGIAVPNERLKNAIVLFKQADDKADE